MVRGAKGTLGDEPCSAREQPRHAMDLCGLDRFLKGQRRQDSRKALREHGFTRSWRADEKHIVPAGRRHFERPLGRDLPAHVVEIRNR
jgi:hypothetical protein